MRPEWKKYTQLLVQEVVPAIGCTEPVAVAFAAAKAAEVLGVTPHSIHAKVSANLLKNGMGVGVPRTGQRGLEIAAAVGAIGGNIQDRLELLKNLTAEHVAQAKAMLSLGNVRIDLAESDALIYCEIIATNGENESRVVLRDTHTGIAYIERNGEVLLQKDLTKILQPELAWDVTIAGIYSFVTEVPLDELELMHEAARMNLAIAMEGLRGNYGLEVGKSIKENIKRDVMSDDLVSYAIMLTSAGADARMHGVNMPVMSNSGSGNQGLCCTLPVVAAATKLGSCRNELLRALAMSHLVSIHIKHHLGKLSPVCGASVAGAASACGIVMLMGGERKHIENTIKNMIGNVTGMICDGAKNGCALKVASSVSAGIQSAMLALQEKSIRGCEGIVSESVEQSIRNLGAIGSSGMVNTDKLILKIMIDKINSSECPKGNWLSAENF